METEQFTQPICLNLRATALRLPETSEGASCVNRAFKARKKNFLFVGEKPTEIRVMLKLSTSLTEAEALNDARISVGKGGWVTMRFAPDNPLDESLLAEWVIESYKLLAPKSLSSQL